MTSSYEINANKGMMPKLFLIGIIAIIAFESLLSINFTIYKNFASFMIINMILCLSLCFGLSKIFKQKQFTNGESSDKLNDVGLRLILNKATNSFTNKFSESKWLLYFGIILGIIINNNITQTQSGDDPYKYDKNLKISNDDYVNDKKFTGKNLDFNQQYGKGLISGFMSKFKNLFLKNIDLQTVSCKPNSIPLYLLNLVIVISLVLIALYTSVIIFSEQIVTYLIALLFMGIIISQIFKKK